MERTIQRTVITGADGFIGRHMQVLLRTKEDYRDGLVALDRVGFNDDESLEGSVESADTIIHCAGINRDEDSALVHGNVEIAQRLVRALVGTGAEPHLFYLNSTQGTVDSPYGRGKRAAHTAFSDWISAGSGRATYTNVVLPHVFGEGCRPNYNSAIATFCSNIAEGRPLSINPEGKLELVHVQDVASQIVGAMEQECPRELRLIGKNVGVPEAAALLEGMYKQYCSDTIPDLRDRFNLQLFNTLRSYLFPKFYPRKLELHSDQRGALFEAVKSHNGGQAFLSWTKPGVMRGNHFHFNKVERFLVVQGDALIRIRSLLDGRIEEFSVSGREPAYIDMPTLHTHSISNTGTQELLTVFWTSEIFDPNAPDTFSAKVIEE